MSFARIVASGGGAGFARRAPGTFGSLVGLVLGAGVMAVGGHGPLVFGVLVVFAVGVWAVEVCGVGGEDPGWVVVDEVAGQMLAVAFLGVLSFWGLVLAFGLFRLFDIWKPGPVGWVDRQHNVWGLMVDDVLAGLLAGAVLVLVQAVVRL